MNLLKRTAIAWIIRTLGVLLCAVAVLIGGAGQAFADDDDTEVVTYGPNACSVVAALPAYPSATCVKHKTEIDDGVTEIRNSYVARGAADTGDAVRRYYETTFQQQGWTLVKAKRDVVDQEWEYTIVKGQRHVQVDIEVLEPDEGSGTAITVEE